ncbi:S8 family serine peptidase [Pseudoflavitalea sp. G-6-1-2]|uniref:S8 family serine peptidase n=1 Tax=Pseudoflavitalea sp. G-6-1-2 TaxID=2728841 RepID=UPI00146A7A27|nr:S8 family serine peptidase [Pseudoflavitalea sp. G-6-1-2]NML20795.1 S8 family serine peptidase [Pseudoflavitalea sp. G-6-1-2]
MPKLPHVKLNTSRQNEGSITLKFNYGFSDEEVRDDNNDKDYRPMARAFQSFLNRFRSDIQSREGERNEALNVPHHIDYIQITFFSQFVTSAFYNRWFNEFGILGVNFSKFNTEVLFAITDREKFNKFYQEIENFIDKELNKREVNYSPLVIYIKEFRLLTSEDIIQFQNLGSLMNLRLVDDFPLGNSHFQPILLALENYLTERNIPFSYSIKDKHIEVITPSQAQIEEIVKNYDIVLSVTSALSAVISPSELNLPERSYGFTINDVNTPLPIIGILDTGISDKTPLKNILINDQTYDLTNSNVFEDNVNHGTAVAALAALGKKAYSARYRGKISSDARLLSMKISDNSTCYLSQKDILALLHRAKQEYPEIKLFVLTTCFQHHKQYNEDHSAYAFALDTFAHENDCLVLICTANNDNAAFANTTYDPRYFLNEDTNICTPAESMNNLTIGAAADSLRAGHFVGISSSKEFPTLYTRKSHIDLHKIFPFNKINKHYFKPDVIECGGDYEFSKSGLIGSGANASMEVLSANETEGFISHVGTSYSTPLVANIAAQIQRAYPNIKSQSIKALIINSASLNAIRFPTPTSKMINKIAGHGLTNEVKSVYSDEDSITFLLEEEIKPETLRLFPLHFPEYLVKDRLGKKNGILKITATLCFSFAPVINHQLGYCPIHIAFCFFKNQTGTEIQATDENIKSLLKSNLRWTQSGRHVSKPIPYCNTQKITFPVNVQDLINENGIFKLAVQCRINPQLIPGTEIPYQKDHPFSIVITIEESLKESKLTGKLYNEMILTNYVENIGDVNIEQEGTLDVE